MTEQQRFHDKQWSLIVARAWADEEFKSRLMSHPKAVLREHGLEMAPEVEVKVLEDTDKAVHFTLPVNPSGELSEEELSPTAGADSHCGGCGGCGGCRGCRGCRCGCGGCGCGCRGCIEAF